jgi:hypothetical protein
VAHGAIIAIVLLRPVEDSLGECHGCRGETDERRRRPGRDVRGVQVQEVQERLDDVEERWGSVSSGRAGI